MSLADFIRRRELVEVGGTTYEVRPPTSETVVLWTGYYGAEIAAAAKVYREHPEAFDEPSAQDDLFLMFASDLERAGSVLETCVIPRPASEDAVIACARALVGLCDFRRILDSTGMLDEEHAEAAGEVSPSDQETVICLVAQQHGTDPMAVMRWPYEAMLTAAAVIEAQGRAREGAAGGAIASSANIHDSRAALTSLGLIVHQAKA